MIFSLEYNFFDFFCSARLLLKRISEIGLEYTIVTSLIIMEKNIWYFRLDLLLSPLHILKNHFIMKATLGR